MVSIPGHDEPIPGVTRIERLPTSSCDGPCVRTGSKPSSGALGLADRPVGEPRSQATPARLRPSVGPPGPGPSGLEGARPVVLPAPLKPLPSSSPSTPSSAPPHGEVKTDRRDPPPASSRDVQVPIRGGPGEDEDKERFLENRSSMEQNARAHRREAAWLEGAPSA
jgi:hypothetical protein